MNKLLLITFCFITASFTKWEPDFSTAVQTAREKHRLILVNFSGSDWCGPCIRMRNEIFENEIFSKMADTCILLVNADFPRNRKNQLSKPQVKQNEMLADKFNPNGSFPYTVLINAEGKLIKAWDGLPKENAEQFAREVKAICDANK
jgi:thiol-disulfide isomerase/thioredoxin